MQLQLIPAWEVAMKLVLAVLHMEVNLQTPAVTATAPVLIDADNCCDDIIFLGCISGKLACRGTLYCKDSTIYAFFTGQK